MRLPTRLAPIVFLFVGLGAGALLYQFGRPRPAADEPLIVPLGDWDLGLLQERTATHTLELRNDGPGTWTVNSAEADCACLTVTPRSQITAPGETLVVDLHVSPGARRGPMRLRYWVEFAEHGRYAVGEMRADVWLGAYLDPNTVEVSLPPQQSDFRGETTLWTLDSSDVHPVAIEGDTRASVTIGASIADGGRLKWPLTIVGSLPDSDGDRHILQQISADGEQSALPLSIVVRRPPVLRSSPSAAVLAAGRSGKLMRVQLWKGRDPAPRVKRVEVQASEPGLRTSLQAAWTDEALELTSSVPLELGHGTVRIFTDDGDELLLPFHVLDPSAME